MSTVLPPRKTKIAFASNADPQTMGQVPDRIDNPTGDQRGQASYDRGFPLATMIPPKADGTGGIPPDGRQFNALLNDLSHHAQWQDIGGGAYFDTEWASQMGGYPKQIILRSTRYPYLSYENMIDGNKVDPDDPVLGASPSLYWDSGAQPGNGWALRTIPARRANGGLGYTSDFRLITADALNLPKTTIASYKGSVYWENVK